MATLKGIIRKYMYQITAIVVASMLLIVLGFQLLIEQRRAYENSMQIFTLIDNRLNENQQELNIIKEEYRQTCLYNAQVIDQIVEKDPDILDSLERLRNLAKLLEIDEIHIIDSTGRIFAGTHPEYYNLTLDSGEQISFFEPMLEDKNLSLVQEITPNTAEGKLMQYSAVWSKNGEYIVQVGMEPVNVRKLTEKNEISYIFSTFKVNSDADYYDIDAASGKIIGTTNSESIGHDIEEVGIDFDDIKNDTNGFYARVNGHISFCVFRESGDNYLGRVVAVRNLYQRIPPTMLLLSVCMIFMAFVLVYAVTKHINKYVVNEIQDINDKLDLITNGKFDETIDVRSSIEFSALSDYLNTMLKSIIDQNVKMSYVLNKTNLLIGVYEYNDSISRVQFTEYVPQILSIDVEEMNNISLDVEAFKQYINDIHKKNIPDEPNVFKVGEKYIKLDEIKNDTHVFGVVMDVTADIMKRKEIETERDIDLLTGLLNRRGLETKLKELFANPDSLGYYSLIMIDADGLKTINDTYGHESGDIYLKKIATVINNVGIRDCIASRLGGDEFVLFLYNYDNEDDLRKTIDTLEYIENNSSVRIRGNVSVPLRFSSGYSMARGEANYSEMLKEADKYMYKNKVEHHKKVTI